MAQSRMFTPALLPARAHGGLGLATLLRWHAIARQRRALARLDDAALRDLGLTRDEALREAQRPAWDIPAHLA